MKFDVNSLFKSPDVRKYAGASALLSIAFFVIYFFSHDRLYHVDTVQHGGTIEQPIFLPTLTPIIFGSQSFLWIPVTRMFYLTLNAAGIHLRGYQTLQLFNSLAGSIALGLIFFWLSRQTKRSWALVWTAVIGFSHLIWYRAAGGEYLLMAALWLVPFCIAARAFLLKPSWLSLTAACASAAFATYFHISNLAAWMVIPILFGLTWGSKSYRLIPVAAGIFAVIAVPYGLVHGLFKPGGIPAWWTQTTALIAGINPAHHPTGGFNLRVFANASQAAWSFLQSFIAAGELRATTLIGLFVITSLFIFPLYDAKRSMPSSPEKRRRHIASGWAFGLTSLVYIGLFSFWRPGNYEYWVMQPVLLPMLAALVLYDRYSPRRPIHWVCFSTALLLLVGQNLTQVIVPNRSNKTATVFAEAAARVRAVVPPQGSVVINGWEWGGRIKTYIPYFARRNRLVVELFCIEYARSGKTAEAINAAIFSRFLNGFPVYLMESATQTEKMLNHWDVPSAEMDALWNSFRKLPVACFADPTPNGLYLLYSDRVSKEAKTRLIQTLERSGLTDQAEFIRKRPPQ